MFDLNFDVPAMPNAWRRPLRKGSFRTAFPQAGRQTDAPAPTEFSRLQRPHRDSPTVRFYGHQPSARTDAPLAIF
jgi:hypothetical protein